MAGWRAPRDGEADEPIELVDDGDRTEVELAGGRSLDWHAVLRTSAAVVGALSLLWIGRSWADERADAERSECTNELQNAMWRWEEAINMAPTVGTRGPQFPDDVVDSFIARAEECGDDLVARAIVHRFSRDEDR